MQDRYEHKDFEQFVKQSADQYRMFPSDKVWNNIHRTLHTRRRWYGIGLTLLLLTTAVVTWVMLLDPGTGNTPPANSVASRNAQAVTEQKTPEPEILVAAIRPDAKQPSGSARHSKQPTNHFFTPAGLDLGETITVTEHADPVVSNDAINAITARSTAAPAESRPVAIRKSSPVQNSEMIARTSAISELQRSIFTSSTDEIVLDAQTPAEEKSTSVSDELAENGRPLYPMTIESVINTYQKQNRRKKLSWQLYVVPTISYRELKENMAFIRAARSNGTVPTSQLYPDLNSAVNHKPDLGFELGFSAGYPVSKNFKFIAGLQFNVSKYDIQAYNNQPEVATIALDSGPGANSLSTTSDYRSYGPNNQANWLRNLYFSASAPVGVEVKFNSNKKSYAGFTTTLQPSYMLSNKSYLLSTDYKNYAEVPSLMRKWNLNTGFEIFAGYTTKKLEWRIGPQVRYQALSSFVDKYPVREHLFDFGLKVGVMLK